VERDALIRRYQQVRARTETLAAPLSSEDMLVQSMPDASPTKWHLAHTTWFFEEFVLARFDPGHRWHDERWRVLFNSYYEAAGPRHPRAARGLLSRPALDEVRAWRASVDERMIALLARGDADALAVVLLGTHHEEQHQELILTDVKHALASSPLRPAYLRPERPSPARHGSSPPPAAGHKAAPPVGPADWIAYEERVALVGHEGPGFAFDNEGPRHKVLVGPFTLASRLVTNAEYARFVEDGGYDRPELWLSDGWATARAEGWGAPLYWERTGGGWDLFTLRGLEPLDGNAPVTHASYYEADAYARWAGRRLPTENEWEIVAAEHPSEGNFLETERLAAAPLERTGTGPAQLFGDAWEWTASAYLPYPKYRPLAGALGEYNGKFMSGQMVLRGGSCLSPRAHLRASYRNFFPPHVRWQMAGIRLAGDA
jgi:ergothioneine biosynthesis protein EgtB